MRQNQLMCIDPLTGSKNWQVGHFKENSDVTCDNDTVCVIEPASKTVHLLRMADGSKIKEVQSARSANDIWTTIGTSAIYTERVSKRNLLVRYDFLTQNEIWNLSFDSRSKANFLPDHKAALLQPDGRFVILDLISGEILLDKMIGKPEKTFANIRVEPIDGYYQLIINKTSSPSSSMYVNGRRFYSLNYSNPLIDGTIQLIDRKTGEPRWAKPAHVQYFSFPDYQPRDLPYIVLGRMVNLSNTGPQKMQLAGIDMRNGREAFLVDDSQSSSQVFSVSSKREKNLIEIFTGSKKLTITLTDEVIPPSPPARLDLNRAVDQYFADVKIPDQKTNVRRALQRALGNKIVPANKEKQADDKKQKADPKQKAESKKKVEVKKKVEDKQDSNGNKASDKNKKQATKKTPIGK
jgi:hypothetical protein